MVLSNSFTTRRCSRRGGYTLVEVLLASSVLVMGIAAACILSLAMTTQEEMNHRLARGLNVQENAARLWQLGIAESSIFGTGSILPANPDVEFATAPVTTTMTGIGDVSGITVTATLYSTPSESNAPMQAHYWTGGAKADGSDRDYRTNDVTVYRTLR